MYCSLWFLLFVVVVFDTAEQIKDYNEQIKTRDGSTWINEFNSIKCIQYRLQNFLCINKNLDNGMETFYIFSAKNHLLKNLWKHKYELSRTAVKLAYKLHGKDRAQDNQTIVVLHGLLGSKKNWDSMCKRMAQNTQKSVVAFDARNHGESPHEDSHSYIELALDVSHTMDTLSINRADVVGHSMGGRTGMVLALTEPEKVLKLAVVDISPVSTAGILNNFFPRLLEVMKYVDFSGVDLAQARTLAKDKIKASGLIQHEGMMAFIIMNVGKRPDNTIGWMCNVDALGKYFNEIASFPDLGGKKYEGPTLFIGGEKSNYIPPGDIVGIRGLFPKAELKYVPNVGHNVHAEDPASFLTMVTDFMKQT